MDGNEGNDGNEEEIAIVGAFSLESRNSIDFLMEMAEAAQIRCIDAADADAETEIRIDFGTSIEAEFVQMIASDDLGRMDID
jgi:hypothetical protein